MLTPENKVWCVVVLAVVMGLAYGIAWLLRRREDVKRGARLDQSGGDR